MLKQIDELKNENNELKSKISLMNKKYLNYLNFYFLCNGKNQLIPRWNRRKITCNVLHSIMNKWYQDLRNGLFGLLLKS